MREHDVCIRTEDFRIQKNYTVFLALIMFNQQSKSEKNEPESFTHSVNSGIADSYTHKMNQY
jgi:hypothetical protein